MQFRTLLWTRKPRQLAHVILMTPAKPPRGLWHRASRDVCSDTCFMQVVGSLRMRVARCEFSFCHGTNHMWCDAANRGVVLVKTDEQSGREAGIQAGK